MYNVVGETSCQYFFCYFMDFFFTVYNCKGIGVTNNGIIVILVWHTLLIEQVVSSYCYLRNK